MPAAARVHDGEIDRAEPELIPDLDDPKDLFGDLVRDSAVTLQPHGTWTAPVDIRRAADSRLGS